jgi:glycosyltransferase involved in cell wall biosynthesis
MKKKLLIFATQLMETGGIESHVREFCKQINSIDIEIDLMVLNSKLLPDDEAYYRGICNNVYLCTTGRSQKRLLWLIKYALKLMVNRYDAIYTNGQGNSIILINKLIQRRGPWVHHHHTAGDDLDRATWTPGYYKALKSADVVIACAQSNARKMEAALGRKINSITCFSRKITISPRTVKKEHINFGYFGRLIPEKGIDMLCNMSEDADLKNMNFHIWGEGEKYSIEYFKQFPSIHYHGVFRGENGLAAAMGAIDAFLLISTHPEGLPISLLEVMSAGLPWLATDRGGIADIAFDNVSTRVIPAFSEYSIVKSQIIKFAEDLSSGKISANSQIELYNKKFSSAVLIKQWKNVLQIN